MNIQEYIESGILEAYVLGSVSEAEASELLYLKEKYPEVKQALYELEMDMEHIAQHMAVPPPPLIWMKVEQDLDELIAREKTEPVLFRENGRHNYHQSQRGSQYIEVEAIGSHIRIHKSWRLVFAAIFILGKIFLACAIYFYLENKHAQEQIQDLKSELKHYQSIR